MKESNTVTENFNNHGTVKTWRRNINKRDEADRQRRGITSDK
jgi:hypothetical protein